MKENKRFDSMRVSRPCVLVKRRKSGSAPADPF
jgi:ubiquitin carboxyl-terminal hydrolase 10